VVGPIAVALVIVAVALAGATESWSSAAWALAFQYLGVALLTLATTGASSAALVVVVGCGVEGILFAPPLRSRRALAASVDWRSRLRWTAWRPRTFRLRWFDASVAAVAIVGAIDLAAAHPVFGSGPVDDVVDVLIFTGLLFCLVGRSARTACGLLFLASAGGVALQANGETLTRLEAFLLAVVALSLAIALARLRAAEERTVSRGSRPAAQDGDALDVRSSDATSTTSPGARADGETAL